MKSNKYCLTHIKELSNSWQLNRGTGSNQIATFTDLGGSSKECVTVGDLPYTGSKNGEAGKWSYSGSKGSNQLVKYSELTFNKTDHSKDPIYIGLVYDSSQTRRPSSSTKVYLLVYPQNYRDYTISWTSLAFSIGGGIYDELDVSPGEKMSVDWLSYKDSDDYLFDNASYGPIRDNNNFYNDSVYGYNPLLDTNPFPEDILGGGGIKPWG